MTTFNTDNFTPITGPLSGAALGALVADQPRNAPSVSKEALDALTVSSTEPPKGGKGGEGGVFQITNAEFGAAVFPSLPGGRLDGINYVVRNPHRNDLGGHPA
jgi:hypothetical protein